MKIIWYSLVLVELPGDYPPISKAFPISLKDMNSSEVTHVTPRDTYMTFTRMQHTHTHKQNHNKTILWLYLESDQDIKVAHSEIWHFDSDIRKTASSLSDNDDNKWAMREVLIGNLLRKNSFSIIMMKDNLIRKK